MSERISILEALAAVNEDDLVAIDAELAEIEKRRTMLLDARRIINAKLHPESFKRPGGYHRKKDPGDPDVSEPGEANPRNETAKVPVPSLSSQIRDVIEAGGPMTPAEITRQLSSAGREVTEHGVRIAIARSAHFFQEGANGRFKLAGR